jgi:ubiquinone/menaquinone biosynthesis C-methylase UbiE
MKPINLNLGCGIHLVKDFINVDSEYEEVDIRGKQGIFVNANIEEDAVYVKADIRKLPFKDNYADYAEAIDVVEHIPISDVGLAFNEMFRVMKPGSVIKIVTPDMNGVFVDFIRGELSPTINLLYYNELAQVIYGNQKYYGEFHKCPFTPRFLMHCLTTAGFSNLRIEMYRGGTPSMMLPKLKTVGQLGEDKKFIRNDYLFAEGKKP